MADLKTCPGVTNAATNEPRRVCQSCERRTGQHPAALEPKAHRVTAQRWVCVNRIERVAA